MALIEEIEQTECAEEFSFSPSTSENQEEQAELLKQKGNECYKQKRFHKAIDFYSKALAFQVSSVILSNRSQAYLNLHMFEKAYTDSNEAFALDPANLKALYRRAVSENKLGLKAKACLDLEDCVKGDAKNVEAKSLLDSLKNSVDKPVVDVTCFHKSEQIQSKKPLVRKLITEV
uniref:Uncharacterized protein n=1 Tax=Ditylenchus dipsaci TaxID=166011 RepID=A0A915EIB8_9BILA